MRKTYTFLLLLILISCGPSDHISTKLPTVEQLHEMYENHQYFELRDKLVNHKSYLSGKDFMVVNSQLHSVFNRRKASDSLIERIFSQFGNELSAKQQIDLLETKISNNLFLFNYYEALRSTERLLSISPLPVETEKEYKNQLIIFKELENTPAQTVDIIESELPLIKDIAGLSRIPVRLHNVHEEVVFDTGANFSVITDSLALKAGIQIKDRTFKVTSITGKEIDSRIGVADSVKIGNSVIYNVVFLIFPESSLSFNNGQYTIDAILGFPVINALEKIELIEGKTFVISKAVDTPVRENMALDFLTPVVEVCQEEKSLAFTFDTGATTTALYEEYFRLNEESIKEAGVRDTINLGGAGGAVKVPVFKAPFSGSIGGRQFHLNSANIYTKNQVKNPGIYGNLGQDVLGQFDTLSLDFKNMRINLK